MPAMVEEHHTCSAGNMVFCDGQGAVADVEIRPEVVAPYRATPDRRPHTNHYLTPQTTPRGRHPARLLPAPDRLRELVQALGPDRCGGDEGDHLPTTRATRAALPARAKGSYSITGTAERQGVPRAARPRLHRHPDRSMRFDRLHPAGQPAHLRLHRLRLLAQALRLAAGGRAVARPG